jgi:sugar (pentulose or hexulose) kinase
LKSNPKPKEVLRVSAVLVGVDVGTTSAKAVATTVEGEVLSVGRAPLVWSRTVAGAEIDAYRLVEASLEAIRQALSGSGAGQVIGLGIASMGESSVLLDAFGRPVAPVIAWHDSRDREQLGELADEIGEQAFMAETGLPFRTQWSLTKHRWQTRYDARSAAAVTRLGVAEWVVRALGGEEVCEQSLGSRTGWLRLHERAWWDQTTAWSGLELSALPALVAAGTAVGVVSAAQAPSSLVGATLTVAGHDHQAATVGAGATQVGTVLDSCGTAEALVRTISPGLGRPEVVRLAEAGITVGWHAKPDHWCLLGGTQGGLALQRVLAMLGLTHSDIAALDAGAGLSTQVVIEGVDEDSLAIVGVGDTTGPADVWHAALRAVAARGEEVNAAMSGVVGPHTRFVVTGGWAASSALVDEKRRIFGPLEVLRAQESGARGAALLAGAAVGAQGRPENGLDMATTTRGSRDPHE